MESEIKRLFKEIEELLEYADIDMAHALDSFSGAVEKARELAKLCKATAVETREEEEMCKWANFLLKIQEGGICAAFYAVKALNNLRG